jgi:RNA polymerase sigma-70 factor (ECF subfamily)
MNAEEIDRVVERAKRGDRDAFRRLVIELESDLRVFLCAFEVSEGLSEEVLQQTFVTAYHKLSMYQPQAAFRAWLKAIARNHLLKELREQRRFAASGGDALGEIAAESGLDDFERMDELEFHTRRLRACIERLPATARELVEGRYLRQQAIPSLAGRFKRTEVWVRVTLCRIRKSLRQCMEAREAA